MQVVLEWCYKYIIAEVVKQNTLTNIITDSVICVFFFYFEKKDRSRFSNVQIGIVLFMLLLSKSSRSLILSIYNHNCI
jgi:hypothetical protein